MVTPEKVCILEEGLAVVLSDCVLAVEFKSSARLKSVREYLIRDWSSFSGIYGGTGAKYTTVKKASLYFDGLLAAPELLGAGRDSCGAFDCVVSLSESLSV
jgi:hypothetical protein